MESRVDGSIPHRLGMLVVGSVLAKVKVPFSAKINYNEEAQF